MLIPKETVGCARTTKLAIAMQKRFRRVPMPGVYAVCELLSGKFKAQPKCCLHDKHAYIGIHVIHKVNHL